MQTLTALLDEIAGLASADRASRKLTLADILRPLGRGAYGPLLLVIGLFSISPATALPGLTWFAAGLTAIIAMQMLFGVRKPWLPEKALTLPVEPAHLHQGVVNARPLARWAEAALRPRLQFLAEPPWLGLSACAVLAAALITIPLGFIPFAPLAPGLAVVLIGLGITMRDGLLLTLGTGGVAGAGALAASLFSLF